MELVLSAIAAGGLVGVADQYLCLLIVSGAAKVGLISLLPQMRFMESWLFIAVVFVFWVLTVLPQYGPLIAPGIMNTVGTIINFLSGFVVPVSSAFISLASVGIITALNPELNTVLQTLRIFDPSSGLGLGAAAVAGGGAVSASALTGIKALAKPAVSATTGTSGTISAPMYATFENVASIIVMGIAYVLARINPWLVVLLLAALALMAIALFVYSIYQLRRLKQGIGKVFYLLQTQPKVGLAIVAEFVVWGAGWLIWGFWARGVVMLVIWLAFVAVGITLIGISAPTMVLVFPAAAILTLLFALIGIYSARALMHTLEAEQQPRPPRMKPSTGVS